MCTINADPQGEASFFFKCLLPQWIGYFTRREKEGTILFVDMSDSVWNKFADHLEAWSLNIRTLHHRASKIIHICNGTVSKTIGDCVMAYFLGEGHRENACLCAMSLLEPFFLLKRSYDLDGLDTLFRFPVTLGVASGPLLFLKQRDPYGLAVDLAARLQGCASPGEAVVFADSYQIKNKEIASLTEAYKGKSEVVNVKSFGEVAIVRIATPDGQE